MVSHTVWFDVYLTLPLHLGSYWQSETTVIIYTQCAVIVQNMDTNFEGMLHYKPYRQNLNIWPWFRSRSYVVSKTLVVMYTPGWSAPLLAAWKMSGTCIVARRLFVQRTLYVHYDACRWARGLYFCLNLYLQPYFVCKSSKSSVKSAVLHRLTWSFVARQRERY